MDQIFNRLERLFKSWGSSDPMDDDNYDWNDPDMQEAWAELEGDLEGAKKARERRKSQQEQFKQKTGGSTKTFELQKAYLELGVPLTATWEEIQDAHKSLLKKHHPDRHASDPAAMKKATVKSQVINAAFQKIKDHMGK